MKTTHIGILLLTLLVITKYYISSSELNSSDGHFPNGIALTNIYLEIEPRSNETSNSHLIAKHTPLVQTNSTSENETKITRPGHATNGNSEQKALTSSNFLKTEKSEDVLPMEHRHSLVVYDPQNPSIQSMRTEFTDQYDQATPLDYGNTVVNELQMMMPRR